MSLTREDLLEFSKATGLVITLIEDDSSDTTEVKILHLADPVQATGSIPTPEGLEMKVKGNKVWVASDDIDKMLAGCKKENGKLVYKGNMHLDVSKPLGRTNNAGEYEIFKPARIWLTSTKFSRGGSALRQTSRTKLQDVIKNMWSGGKVIDLTADTTANVAKKPEAEVVAGTADVKKN